MERFTAFVSKKHSRLPVFYHAHSFGTLVAMDVTGHSKEIKPAGVILHSVSMPLLIERENFIKGAIFKLVSPVRFPHVWLGEGMNDPTGDKTLNCLWWSSPDRLTKGYKVGYLYKAAKLGHQSRLFSKTISIPVLALEGARDQVVAKGKKAKLAYDKFLRTELCDGKAKVICYRYGFHTMTLPKTGNVALDCTSQKAMADITRWLNQQSIRVSLKKQ